MKNAHAPTFRAKPVLDVREGVASVVLRLLFSLLFRNRVAKMLAELEALFESWKAGTLPPMPEPRVRNAQPAPAPRTSQRHTYVRRRPVTRIPMRDFRPARPRVRTAYTANPSPNPLKNHRTLFKILKNRDFDPGIRTLISLGIQNK